MPPKRKRAEQTAATTATAPPTTTRSTRSSTRNNTASAASTPAPSHTELPSTKDTQAKKNSPTADDDAEEDDEVPPPRKKAARTKNTVTAKSSSRSSVKAAPPKRVDKEPSAPGKATTKKPEKDNFSEDLNPFSYTPARLNELFDKYADEPPTDDTISPEGLEQLCTDADISMAGVLPLLLAWCVKAETMGSITKTEWVFGLSDMRIDTAAKLGIAMKDLEKIVFASNASGSGRGSSNKMTPEVYNRERLKSYERDPEGTFRKLYQYCFGLAKAEQQRNVDVQTAMALWNVLLVPKYTIMSDIVAFLEENSSLKGVTKDLWNMVPEFCKSVDKNLNGYDESEAWPSVIDDFVRWKKEQMANAS